MRTPSLRARMVQRLLPALVGLFVLSGAISYYVARHHANRVYDRWLAETVEVLAHRVTLQRGRPVLDLPEAVRQIVEWDSVDSLHYRVVSSRRGHIAGEAELLAGYGGLAEPGVVSFGDHLLGSLPVRVAALRVTLPGTDEEIRVLAAETLNKRNQFAAELLLSAMLPGLLLIALVVTLVPAGLRRDLAPVSEVAEALDEQTHHSLEPVDDRALPSELRPLTHALNDLLVRLRGALDAQRDFLADAAHQLRTPLTALTLHIDDALREPLPERARDALREVQRAAHRAVRLSNQLLLLARAEPSARVVAPVRFDIRALAFEVGASWVPRAVARGIDLGIEGGEGAPFWVRGDRELLGEAFHNLLDNALKYCEPGARVTMSVAQADGGRVRVAVEDDGPGILESERARVVQRFYRGISSRGAAACEGSGLGLAIVSDIARVHGGELRLLEGHGGRGTRAELVFARAVEAGLPAAA